MNWAWSNIKADAFHEFDVTVVDPPAEYTVTGEILPDSLYFGGLNDISSDSGTGDIQMTFDENGNGVYEGSFEIDTSKSSLSDTDFTELSKITITEKGSKTEEVIMGEATVDVYFTGEVSQGAYDLLLANTGFSETMLEPYFQNLSSFTSYIEDDHIVLKGEGILMASTFHDDVENLIVITEDKIVGNYSASGSYAEISGEDVLINMSFGPYLNVPLSNTELSIDSPYSISSVSPQPDSSNGILKWSQTPLQLFVEGKKTQETPGFEMILLISVLMFLLFILKIRKEEK